MLAYLSSVNVEELKDATKGYCITFVSFPPLFWTNICFFSYFLLPISYFLFITFLIQVVTQILFLFEQPELQDQPFFQEQKTD